MAIALIVVHWCHRAIDRNLVKIGTAETNQLGIRVGEQAALQQRIVGEVDARNDVPGVKRHLLRFGEEVVRIAVEGQLADALTGTSSSGMSLVGSSRSKSNLCSSFSSTIWTPNSHSGKSPFSMASHRSRR